MSEDRQPNEARLSRKGNAAPPTVRSSAPVTNWRDDRGLRAHGPSTHARRGWDDRGSHHEPSHSRREERRGQSDRGRDRRSSYRDSADRHYSPHPISAAAPRPHSRPRSHSRVKSTRSRSRSTSPVRRGRSSNGTSSRPTRNMSPLPPRGPRYPDEMPVPGTGTRRSRHSSPARSPRTPSTSLWTPTGANGTKRQRISSRDRTPPRARESPRSSRFDAENVSHAPSPRTRSEDTLRTPPGQFSVKFMIPPEALGVSKSSLNHRKSWFLSRRREVESDGARFTTCRWFDDHLIVFAKHPTARSPPRTHANNAGPRDQPAPCPQEPYVYSFTSGTLRISKPTLMAENANVHTPTASSPINQVHSTPPRVAPHRAGIPPPTSATTRSRPVSSSALVVPPPPAPAPFTRPPSSTAAPTPRIISASRSISASHTAPPSARHTPSPGSAPAIRSSAVARSQPLASPPPAIAILSSPSNMRSSSPGYSPRRLIPRSLSPLPETEVDMRATHASGSTQRPSSTRKPSASQQPPANEVILISSDDDGRRSSSSSSSDEEDELPSPRNVTLTLRRNSFSPRFTPSPPPSPEPDLGSLPTDEFEMNVEATVSLPNDNKRDKPRRILVDRPSGSVFTVMYHGFVDRYGRASRRRTNVYVPPVPAKEHAEDACAIELRDSMHILVAHSHLSGGKELTLVSRSGDVHHFKRRLRPGDKAGANAVCALPNPRRFVAAGADHAIYHWTITATAPPSSARLDSDSEDEFKAGFSAHERVLPYKHTSAVHALLPLTNTLLASGGADCAVRIFDMGAQTLAHTLSPSNAVHNLHSLASTHRNSILLEVSHKELQFEVRDTRLDKTSRVSRFGWDAGKTSGKYVRGAVRGDVFACGDREGVVRVWDLRNTRKPIEIKSLFRGAKVVQVAFDGGRMYAVSEGNELAFINTL